MRKKIVYIAPHLSTGGLPQYLVRKIELMNSEMEVFCIEYEDITGNVLVIQRNRIKNLLDQNHFITLGENKMDLIKIIEGISPDFVHLEEIPEYFLPASIADQIYKSDRKYKIFETSHDSSFDPDNRKIYLPDAFFFVSQWQIDQYANINVPKYLAEYPIQYNDRPDRDAVLTSLGLDPSKKHILNVGLFTPRKNQQEIFEMAKHFDDSVQFHFLGNQADNFKFYWEPLMKDKPGNCVVWGERSDTDIFYSCMDLFLFTSQGNPGNKETMPLVLREAIGWKIPIMLYNLDVYQNYFDRFNSITYLSKDQKTNIDTIKSFLGVDLGSVNYFWSGYNRQENKISFGVLLNHPNFETFGFRIRDAVNGLTYQPMGNGINFVKGHGQWCIPNAPADYSNGYILEFLDPAGNVIQSNKHESWGKEKSTWWPLIYPKTEMWIWDRKLEFHNDPNDHSAYWSYYECVLREDYKEIEKGDVVVDVGANLGFLSLYAIKQGAVKCYSLEPFPKTFEYLVKNTEGLPITPINIGIGSTERTDYFIGGEVTSVSRLSDYKDREGNHYFGENINSVEVKLKPFDQILQENGIGFIDYLKVDCEGGEKDLFNTIDPDYLKYRVKKIAGEIHVELLGVEEYEKIKNQIIAAGFEYSDDYQPGKTLAVFFAKKKPKIKLVHILNDLDGVREKASINSLKQLQQYGIEYVQDVTPLYTETPPADNCLRPTQVSPVPGNYLLSPGHYGCYLGHKKAVCESGDDFDGLLISECDSMLTGDPKEMAEKIIQAYFENVKNDLIWTSFGKQLPGHPHHLVADDIDWSSRVVEAHLYIISKPSLGFLRDLFTDSPWDVTDLWYDSFLGSYKRGVTRKPYALQHPGTSYLDGWFKDGYDISHPDLLYNPSRIDDDVTVVIQTCDKYHNLWRGWYLSFTRYWNWDLGWPVYFCNEEIDLPFNDPRIQQIKSPKSEDAKGFSTRLIDILSQVKTKYVFYIQDDMWLTNKLDLRVLKEGLYKMRFNDWNCLRVHEKLWSTYAFQKTNQFINGERVLRVKPTGEWLLNHNACIWNKDFLMESLLPNEDPWNNEIEGTVRISKKYTDPKIYHLEQRWYYQPGASQGGNVNDFMSQYQYYLELSDKTRKEFDIY